MPDAKASLSIRWQSSMRVPCVWSAGDYVMRDSKSGYRFSDKIMRKQRDS